MTLITDKMDIAACIAELLYLRDTVILPGVGAFEGSYKAAVVDAVQGAVHAPSKKLRFNPHLRLNDGALADLISKNFQWPLAKAQSELDAYCSRLRQALEKREIVEIAGVGRLYIDLEGEYKFLPGQQNFYTPSFGLPEVKFNPVKRQAVQAPVVETTPALPKRPPRRLNINYRSPVFWVLALAVAILAISLFFLLRNLNAPVTGGIVEAPNSSTTQTQVDPEDEDPQQDEDNNFVTGALGEIVDTEGATRGPGVREAVVIIGSFQDEANAELQIQTIFTDGYEAYSDKKDGATRVGIRLGVESDSDMREQLRAIQARYNKKAWVFYPDEK